MTTFGAMAISFSFGLAILLPAYGKAEATGPGTNVRTPYGDLQIFPESNAWNRDISSFPVHPNSDQYIRSIGKDKPLHPDFGSPWNGAPIGIPFVVVSGETVRVPIRFEYAAESDPGPYPIPPDVPIEGGSNATGDRHIIVIDYHNSKLYEAFDVHRDGNSWRAMSGAVFDLSSDKLRPAGWTSADAAGLPIFPGLVRYDEVAVLKEIRHALRFTANKTQRAYIEPARHFASRHRDKNLPPMGLRVRLKAGYDVAHFPPDVQVILTALKKYGMILADNGGDWFISGEPNVKWDNGMLAWLKRVKGRDLEVVYTGEAISD